ncbi:MAG: YggS family pyridoxal phosphate-dependent enzyme [Oscillospiraceae bacterium]|jgi:pyridoxal phosphate enzyme (YggS family)|nr:YggS family pyridoxal phosphate-dependent enzyme [Oscillospiraceae bacterium]
MTEKCSPEFRSIADNIKEIKENIARACAQAGRAEQEVRLMAVTKTVAAEKINAALACGIDLVGENKVQEMLSKLDSLHPRGVEKHLIGHLQTNKVRQVVGVADMIQSLDSVKLAKEIEKQAEKLNIRQKVLLEVNIGNEDSKSGFLPEALEESIHEIAGMPHISVEGLMAIPPICEKSDDVRLHFKNMHKLFIDIRAKKIDNVSMSVLSMGMSGDYKEAILEGATMIRVGSGIFGARIYT